MKKILSVILLAAVIAGVYIHKYSDTHERIERKLQYQALTATIVKKRWACEVWSSHESWHERFMKNEVLPTNAATPCSELFDLEKLNEN